MATAIPTLATGNVLTAAEWNDLTQLNTQVGCFGAGGTLGGSGGNPSGTPGFQLQAEATTINYTAGVGGYFLDYPTTFSNAVIAVTGTIFSNNNCYLRGVGANTTTVGWMFVILGGSSTEASSGSYELSYIAFGF